MKKRSNKFFYILSTIFIVIYFLYIIKEKTNIDLKSISFNKVVIVFFAISTPVLILITVYKVTKSTKLKFEEKLCIWLACIILNIYVVKSYFGDLLFFEGNRWLTNKAIEINNGYTELYQTKTNTFIFKSSKQRIVRAKSVAFIFWKIENSNENQ